MNFAAEPQPIRLRLRNAHVKGFGSERDAVPDRRQSMPPAVTKDGVTIRGVEEDGLVTTLRGAAALAGAGGLTACTTIRGCTANRSSSA